jgi:hypothetical protein
MQIAPKNENSVMLSDNFKSVSFGIKQDGLAHIFGVLRNPILTRSLRSSESIPPMLSMPTSRLAKKTKQSSSPPQILLTLPSGYGTLAMV